ncbi:hypothetical protein SAMN04488020_104158 [Palleronia marisminoris]|uniref:histidine kinase n=1 Tax=Palleronia marisminoris TaxID=315423 RepID=A0A1Y5SIY2_9RHOB|nr:PAS-domain containing protein [Palleronia marisminoris]SFG84114.1 hypothetical protein SAMN04488020_104158 [Palleronia marisminoris]SLN41868.1 Aerobic respiration control sensor protein ArcB [Palleronia marisminoris]
MRSEEALDSERERREHLATDRERELTDRIARLEETSHRLTHEIEAKRSEATRLDRTNELGQVWAGLQSILDGFAIFDRDHRLVVANHAYLSVLDSVPEVAPGITYERMCELLVSERIADTPPDGETWCAWMKGRWRQEEIPTAILRLSDGQFIKLVDRRLPDGGIVTLAINQTGILRLRAAIEALPDGFVVFDADDRLVAANETYLNLVGISRQEAKRGVTFTDILRSGVDEGRFLVEGPDDWLGDRITHHQCENGSSHDFRLLDGRWLRAVDIALPDGGRAGLRIDITEIKAQQIELARLAGAAEAASRAKSAFLSNMSHEIRTPMNGLVGISDLLLATRLDDGQREMAETLRRSAEGLLGLLDDVLDFSQAEAGGLAFELAPIQPRDLLAEIVASFLAEAHGRGLALTLDIAEDVPPAILADARQVRRVLTNLLCNAVKFTRSGGITVRSAVRDKMLSIAVEDTGPGIPPDRAERIFDGFVQIEEGHDRQHDGPGLGLAVCRSLVTQMGGRIDYRARPDGGSIFRISLPIRAATLAPAPAAEGQPARRPATRRARVLAVEDNATNRFVLEKLLEPLDVDLRVVERGADCLAEAMRDPPDLLLTDISMPDMDGLEMTRRLRTWEARTGRHPLRIVAMTAHALAADIEEILAAGLDRVLTKPLKRTLLTEECAAALVRPAQAALAADASLRKKAGASGSDRSGV